MLGNAHRVAERRGTNSIAPVEREVLVRHWRHDKPCRADGDRPSRVAGKVERDNEVVSVQLPEHCLGHQVAIRVVGGVGVVPVQGDPVGVEAQGDEANIAAGTGWRLLPPGGSVFSSDVAEASQVDSVETTISLRRREQVLRTSRRQMAAVINDLPAWEVVPTTMMDLVNWGRWK